MIEDIHPTLGCCTDEELGKLSSRVAKDSKFNIFEANRTLIAKSSHGYYCNLYLTRDILCV
eukprot:snap_masked-scaffold_1-processed-gene-13.20-mRNA-1 protein AED:1.00 eAED:1.00 QI:0/0/0/0/1/1/2/0/60